MSCCYGRRVGGLCQQAWEGEADEGGVLVEWGVWDEQNCWLCNCYVWVFNEPLSSCSLATELLLLAGEVQLKHTDTNTHTKKLLLHCRNFSNSLL